MDLTDYIISTDETILTAMKKIDYNSQGIIYVCKNRQLVGVLTDGDVRRYILKNGDLKQNTGLIANKEPHFLMYGMEREAKLFMKEKQITSVPILNAEMEIIAIRFLKEVGEAAKVNLNLPVVIMAGGKGTRLYPYTQILPKPLIPIGEKTITEHIMDRFENFGCIHFEIVVNYKKNFIKAYFQDNEQTRDISFVEEEDFLGTGGGLKLLTGRLQSTFFMSNCDILIEEDYSKILQYHRKNNNIVTMICAVKNVTIPYGTVEVSGSGKAIRLNEKPSMSFITNTGLYVIEPAFLDLIPKNTFIHITDVIQLCIDQGSSVGVYPIGEEKWLDMGQLDELECMKKRLNREERKLE